MPDVFMISGHAGDVEEVVGLIKEGFSAKWAPKAIIATNGLTAPSNYDPATDIEGVIMPDQWFDTRSMKDSIVGWSSTDFKAALGASASYHAASAGALCVMMAHALTKAGEMTGEVTAESLAAGLAALPPTDTFYGTMDWNADGTLRKPMYGKQHQKTAVEIVAPVSIATASIMALAPTTCGMVKVMYKKHECCGNPSKVVDEGRRLTEGRRLKSTMKTSVLLEDIKSAMNAAGPSRAERLEEKLRKVLEVERLGV